MSVVSDGCLLKEVTMRPAYVYSVDLILNYFNETPLLSRPMQGFSAKCAF